MSVEVPQNPQLVPDGNLTVNPEPQKQSNLSLIILSLLVLILVGVGGFILARYPYAPKTEVPVPSQPPVATPAPTQSPFGTSSVSIPTDETAGWKTYSNSKYAFSFKYPQFLDPESTLESSSVVVSGVDPEVKSGRFVVGGGYTWGVSQTATGMDAFMSCSTDEDCYQKYYEDITRFPRNGLVVLPSVNIGGRLVKGFSFIGEGSSGSQQYYYYPLTRAGKFFLVSFNFVNYTDSELAQKKSLVDQILPTFKFL